MVEVNGKTYFTVSEVAKQFGFSTTRIYQLIQSGELGFCVNGMGKKILSLEHLRAFRAKLGPRTDRITPISGSVTTTFTTEIK